MATTLEQHTVLPPAGPAGGDMQRLASMLAGAAEQERQAKLVGPDGTEVALPDEVYGVLREVADAMTQGLAITIAPQHAVLTTQQAAEMLHISRPTLVRLLEDGEIPFEQRGRHRKVRLVDVLDYQERSRHQRKTMLDELTHSAGEDGTADKIDGFVRTR